MNTNFPRILLLFILVLTVSIQCSLHSYAKDFTIVIDAGHGGKDAGTVHNGGKEKDINLSVALKLGKLINNNYPNIRVLYTRKTDVFVGLQERSDFSNRNKADLFISIHVNSAPNKSVKGTETYVIGLSKIDNNLSVAMRENEAILLEDNYKVRYKGFDPSSAESYIMFQVMQEAYINASIEFANEIQKSYKKICRNSRGVRQDALWVLSQSATPSVLTELGFLTNKEEARFMLSNDGQNALARSLLNAFSAYYDLQKGVKKSKKMNDEIIDDIEVVDDNINNDEIISYDKKIEKAETNSNKYYTIKFMSSKEKFDTSYKDFKRLKTKINRVKTGSWYVYYAGEYKSKAEAQRALPNVKKYYKDAVITKH